MATSPYLIEVATRHQVYLERLKSGEVQKSRKALADLEKGIRDIITALDTDIPNLTSRELRALLKDLEDSHTKILAAQSKKRLTRLEEIAAYEAVFEAKALENALDGVGITVPKARDAMAQALRQPVQATGELMKDFLFRADQSEISKVNRIVRNGYARGLTNAEMINAIRGTKKQNYKDGLMASIARDAESLVRTSVQHVAQSARNMTWINNADIVKGYMIVATLDNVTTTVCRSLDRTRHELNKGPQPPLHWRCRTTTTPEFDDKYDFLDKGATRSAQFGPVDDKTTYYEWLATQSPDFQDSAIGPTHGKLFRDGGLTAKEFARLNLGTNFKPLSLTQMRLLEPLAFERAGI